MVPHRITSLVIASEHDTNIEALETLIGDHDTARPQPSQLEEVVLESARQALGADVVYWFPDQPTPRLLMQGNYQFSDGFCRDLMETLLREAPPGKRELLFVRRKAKVSSPTASVRSVAMVYMGAPVQAWLVAVTLSPRPALRPSHLQWMQLLRKTYLQKQSVPQSTQRSKELLDGFMRAISVTIDAKDPYTYGHSLRVARTAQILGQQLGLSCRENSNLYLAGLLHDIGKIGVPDEVLQKPGALTGSEFHVIQQHPLIGETIVAPIAPFRDIRQGVRNHHERMDGNGYPDKLKGECIPLQARIIAVADAFDAMMSPRPYRESLSLGEVLRRMQEAAGEQLDPKIVKAFLIARDRIEAIRGRQSSLGQSCANAIAELMRDPA